MLPVLHTGHLRRGIGSEAFQNWKGIMMPHSKDGVPAQVSCKILHAQRVGKLSEADQLRYLKLWILAVRERRACLTGQEYGTRYLAYEMHIGARTLRKSLERISEKRLITVFEDETVFVYGVMELHKKLAWKKIDERYI